MYNGQHTTIMAQIRYRAEHTVPKAFYFLTAEEERRLLFARWLVQQGRLSDS